MVGDSVEIGVNRNLPPMSAYYLPARPRTSPAMKRNSAQTIESVNPIRAIYPSPVIVTAPLSPTVKKTPLNVCATDANMEAIAPPRSVKMAAKDIR